ncbi:putative RNA editing complex protein MP18 [Trypanosoma cruzi]|uniref:Putative RNA editing complex protein MP18 n=1 Tax=Trypanosoma cruzi TaxID=5693 RepID=A0A2V2WI64_TRYCR|nr:putative RNA editing complex protein MP18 [Trypanosoma cruzi]
MYKLGRGLMLRKNVLLAGKVFPPSMDLPCTAKPNMAFFLSGKRRRMASKGDAVSLIYPPIYQVLLIFHRHPFGTKTAVAASWVETELIPHAQCVSNITIVGRVLDVTQAMEGVSHVTVFVQGEEVGEEETVTVHCSGDINIQVRDSVKRNVTIFLTGTLRLHPVYEASNNKYYVSPVVHVASPTGTLAVIA